MIGSKLGSYEVEAEIGRGGMGVVYRANQPNLQRQVAVKVLLPHLAQDAEFVERFLREARSAAKLHHPGLVTIFDVGEIDGTYYFSMQWLQGKTLEEKLDEGQIPVEEVVGVASQMAAALGFAHEAGVVHRDVKPANVIVDPHGRAVLTDFGIAKAGDETRLTRVGASVGSPDYMAPEQISGGPVDPRTDLYALGVLMHHLLTGEPPYTGDAPIAVAYQHLNAPVPSARDKRPEVPAELDEVLARLMAKAPEDRFHSADELLTALGAVPGLEVPGPPTGIGTAPIAVGDVPAVVAEDLAEATSDDPWRSLPARVAMAVVAAAVIGGGLFWALGRDGAVAPEGGASQPAAAGGAEPAASGAAAGEYSANVEIQPDLPDLEVWLDGSDQGMTTPATLELAGGLGEERTVELRRDGAVLARVDLTLGPDMQTRWAPALAPPEETFTVSSEPAKARVELDGEPLDGVTPLTVALAPGREYRLQVALDGHEPGGLAFDLDSLPAEQRRDGTLHFPLVASVPPARLVVAASYPVTVEVAGRRRSGEGEVRLSLPPGRHTVELTAPQVFYRDRRVVELESNKARTLKLPPTVTIPVAAEGRCRLSIDGRDVGDLPAPVELTVGAHTFRFEWQGGLVKERRHDIGISTQRIYERRPV